MDDNTNHPEKQSLKDDFEDHQLDDSTARMLSNGKGLDDTHVQVEDESSSSDESFTGLGKEELMKYANDPFWVRTRKILFIAFWLAWVAMLVAAILIIVFAPKCPERPDLKWYQTDAIYKVQPKSFKDTSGPDATDGRAGVGDINGIVGKLDYFSDTLGINAIWINSFFKSGGLYDGNDVEDHKDVDGQLGTMEDFNTLRKNSKKKGMKMMVDFIPNHTGKKHQWFIDSEAKKDVYADFYIWADGTNSTPPNNWVTESGAPAWTYSTARGQWYYHSYHTEYPDLNLHNEDVLNELDEILKFWFNKGVDGFGIQGVQRLMESNETSVSETSTGELTVDQPGNLALIQRWRAIANSFSDKPGRERALLAYVKGDENKTKEYHNAGLHVVLTDALTGIDTNSCDIACLKDIVENAATGGSWKGWMIDDENTPRFGSTVDKTLQKAIQALHLLLPGTAVIYYGDEIAMPNGVVTQQVDPMSPSRDAYRTPMQWDSKANAGFCDEDVTPWLPVGADYTHENVAYYSAHMVGYTILDSFRDLIALRGKESFQFGALEVGMQDKILYFSRKAVGFTNYLVAINGGSKTAAFQGMADELTLAYDSNGKDNIGKSFNTKEAPVGFSEKEVFVFSY